MPKKHEKSFFERLSTLGGAPLPPPVRDADGGDECPCIVCRSDLIGIMPCVDLEAASPFVTKLTGDPMSEGLASADVPLNRENSGA